MMLLSRVPTTALSWRPRPGQVSLVIVVKVTFVLEPGVATLAAEHDPLVDEDQHWDDDPARFLIAASDLSPPKRRVDVLYVGRTVNAGAPARLAVGGLDKAVEPRADRWPALGPVARERRGSSEAVAWSRAWAETPMPDGVTTEVFNVAPADQQLDELSPSAEIALENLVGGAPALRTALPGLAPRVEVEHAAGTQRVAMRADTIVLDGNRALASIVWRGQVGGLDPTQVKRVSVELGAAAPAAPIAPVSEPALTRSSSRTAPVARDPSSGRALPFRAGPPGAAPPVQPAAWTPSTTSGHTFVPGMSAPIAPAAPAPSAPPPPVMAPPPVQAVAPPPPIVAAPVPAAPQRPVPAAVWDAPTYAPGGATPSPKIVEAPRHASAAAHGGLVAASDAAADGVPRAAAARTRPKRAGHGLRLMWHDDDRVLAIRRQPEWKAILAQRERRAPERGDAYAAADKEDASEMAAILSLAAPSSEAAVTDALALGTDDDGRFEPELVRVDGDLTLELDEVALLAALTSTATPSAGKDDELGRAVAAASTFLAVPGNISSGVIAARLCDDVRDAWKKGKDRPFDAIRLDELASRAALEQRAYRKKDVLGGVHVRAALHFAGSTTPIPTYVPEAAAKSLPLFLSLPVRAIAEVHPREDETEAYGAALRVVAIGRVLATNG